MDSYKIGRFIAENRKKLDMTQVQLGEKLGVTGKTVSRWENGNYMPDLSLLQPLAKELGITLNELLRGEYIAQETAVMKSEENLQHTFAYAEQKIAKSQRIIFAITTIPITHPKPNGIRIFKFLLNKSKFVILPTASVITKL